MFQRAMVAAGACLMAAQTGLAAVVFSDGFEGVAGDPGPNLATSTGDFDPAWDFVTEDLSSRQMVVYAGAVTDTSALSASNLISAVEGAQALRLRAGGSAAAKVFPTNALVTVSLTHLEPAANAGTGKMLTVELRQGSTPAVTVGFDKDLSLPAGQQWGFGYYNGASAFRKLAEARTNQWTPITLYADATKDLFYVRYDGKLYHNSGTGYPFRTAVSGMTAIRLGQSAAAGSTLNSYVDAVLVEDFIPRLSLPTMVLVR